MVRASLDHSSVGDRSSAMWHATAALDETAVKRYPLLDPTPRFRDILSHNAIPQQWQPVG